MRLIGLFLFSFLINSVWAKAADHKSLTCAIEVADPEDVEYTIVKNITSMGKRNMDGSYSFSLELTDIHAFYFRPHQPFPKPVFHSEAMFTISAELREDQLTYSTKFYNYAISSEKLMVLKAERREVDVSGLSYTSVRFYNEDATLIDSKSVSRRYVNEEGAKLIGCELRGIDYKYLPNRWFRQG